MVEACPVCDVLWRLYTQADNLHELNGKHRDARGKGDRNTVEILAAEITIAESALPVVGRELRRHGGARHVNGQGDQQQQKELAEKQHKWGVDAFKIPARCRTFATRGAYCGSLRASLPS